jgi:hypothetical protein
MACRVRLIQSLSPTKGIRVDNTKCNSILKNKISIRYSVAKYVKELTYLGSQLNQINSTSSEIQARNLSGNRCYYAYGKLMKLMK